MPNWAYNKLVVSGEEEVVKDMAEHMAQPYLTYHHDDPQRLDPVEVTGKFLLWNAKSPIDLEAYYGWTEPQKAEPFDSTSIEDIVRKTYEEMETGMDWHNWNVRNWGTKWEITDCELSIEKRGKQKVYVYLFETAWSPPDEAVINLSKMFPTLRFELCATDEFGNYAFRAIIRGGEVKGGDVPLTHQFLTDLFQKCPVCSNPESDEEQRILLGCDITVS